jgi:two-component system, OmpR family, alkaline phosphatase synthesis response regulator PhoP
MHKEESAVRVFRGRSEAPIWNAREPIQGRQKDTSTLRPGADFPYGDDELPGNPYLAERPMKRILVIEDDKDIVELVRYNLEKDGYQVVSSGDGASGLAQIRKSPPDVLVLDLMLPKMSGLDVCKEVRKDISLNRLPILILTAKGEEADRVVGLELGADDYVTKPFSPRELAARVKALLRRAEPSGIPSEKALEIGVLRIDPASYRVTRSGKSVPMSTLEFRLLYFLAARPNRVFTRDQLLDGVWGTERFVTPRSVDVYVRRLREKVELDPQHPVYMKTIRGAGYLFETRAS